MPGFTEKYSAFRSRSFTLLFLGQSISFTGTWMQIVAQGWLVERMTYSSFDVGVVAFLAVLPSVFLTPLAGALADRIWAKPLLLSAALLGVLQAWTFWVCYAHGNLSVAGIYALSFAWGTISAIDGPARYGCYTKIVEPTAIPSTMAMNGMLVALGFMFGPAIGGYVIAQYGIGWTFLLNALTFVPAIVTILLAELPRPAMSGRPMQSFFKDAVDGIIYSMDDSMIGPLLRYMGVAMFLGFSYRAIIPVFSDALRLNTQQFGWLSAAPGIGAIMAAFTIQLFFDPKRSNTFRFGGTLVLGGALIGAAFVRSFWLGMVFFVTAGFGLDLIVITTQSVTGALARSRGPQFIGRVMGCGAAVFFFGNAFGSLMIGGLVRGFGLFPTIGCCGVVLFIVAYYFDAIERATDAAVGR